MSLNCAPAAPRHLQNSGNRQRLLTVVLKFPHFPTILEGPFGCQHFHSFIGKYIVDSSYEIKIVARLNCIELALRIPLKTIFVFEK